MGIVGGSVVVRIERANSVGVERRRPPAGRAAEIRPVPCTARGLSPSNGYGA